MNDLFDLITPEGPTKLAMAEGAVLLRRAALSFEKDLLKALAVC
jgi:DNA oxidative demethylase